ncbi:MAG TPA: FG-GAP-like repeat-containing protein, partial [Pyrinomonadaceae bacterium]|nr:FG-GAP-like repeat-containing protein [Pyrinomonadaceae bacterium]
PYMTIQNNEYPVRGGAGLLPESRIPVTGNRNNWIEQTGLQPYSIYAPFQIPYVSSGGKISNVQFLPGVTIKAKGNAIFENFGNPHVEVLGLPNAPVTIEQFVPGVKWTGLEFFQDGDRMEYVIFDGSQRGAFSSVGGYHSTMYFEQMIFRNNDVALNDQDGDLVYVQGTLFNNNGIAVRSDGNASTYRMSGETNPNLFENNGVAVRAVNGALVDARYNWWNSPTGPTTPLNPGGTGDRIEGNPQFQPFRISRPDRADHPPVVRLPRRPFLLTAGSFEGVVEPGQKVVLKWDAFDNNAIVRQKILLSLNSNPKENFTVIADNLPGNQRSYEFTMPANAGTQGGWTKFIRIVAVDDKGQEGWDELNVQVPTGTEPGVLQITTPLAGQTFRSGEEFNLNWTITTPFNDPTFQVFLILDGNRQISFQANGNNTGTFSTIKLPYISTDSARIAVKSQGSINNVKWFYSEPFAIRPDPRYPDAPPTVSMTSPQAGQVFPAGGNVPISWTASDDESLRSFSILYSTDGGRTWLTMVENLSPTTTSYNWQLPPGTGFNDVRVRVVAFDKRFQNSSDGYARSFRTNGTAAPRRTQFDFDGDGRADISVFRGGNWYLQQSTAGFRAIQFGLGSDRIPPADYDGDGKTDIAVYRGGNWYILQSSNNAFRAVNFGLPDDTVQTGDYDGDGRADVAVFRPSNGTWYLQQSTAGFAAFNFGQAGDKPVAADYDGDGKTDFAVFRAGNWYVQRSRDGFTAAQFGVSTDIPVAADYDGDGKADFAVFRSGNWYVQRSRDGFYSIQFGISSDAPVPADYDGDGKTDVAVFRDGNWYLQRSTAGFTAVQFGLSADLPVPAAFLQ